MRTKGKRMLTKWFRYLFCLGKWEVVEKYEREIVEGGEVIYKGITYVLQNSETGNIKRVNT